MDEQAILAPHPIDARDESERGISCRWTLPDAIFPYRFDTRFESGRAGSCSFVRSHQARISCRSAAFARRIRVSRGQLVVVVVIVERDRVTPALALHDVQSAGECVRPASMVRSGGSS